MLLASIDSLLSSEEDPLDRELQARELARIMAKAYPTPTIFLGYVVTEPHAAQRKHLSPAELLFLSLFRSGTL